MDPLFLSGHPCIACLEAFVHVVFQPFNNWMDGVREDLVDIFIVHVTEELQVKLYTLRKITSKSSTDLTHSCISLAKKKFVSGFLSDCLFLFNTLSAVGRIFSRRH